MLEKFFEKNYKKLLIVPLLLLIFGLVVVGNFYSKTGALFDRDVSLKGGISATVYSEDIDINKLQLDLENGLGVEVFVRNLRDLTENKDLGAIVEISETGVSDKLKLEIEKSIGTKLTNDQYSVEEVGSSLGEGFYKDLIKSIFIAFLLIAIVAFVTFRTFVPSTAIVLSAFLDIIVPMAIIDLMGVKINTAGIAAFLLIIGYSVDTDILMTVKVLKRREGGNVYERIVDSAKTGMTMTATTFIALTIGYFITSSLVLKQMFLIINLALVVDVFSTYFMNAGILIWYTKRKHKDEKFWA